MYVNSYIISTLSGSKVEAVKQLVREIELLQVASSLTIPSPRIRGSHGTVVNPNFHSTNSPLDPTAMLPLPTQRTMHVLKNHGLHRSN